MVVLGHDNSKLNLIFDNEDGTFPKKILMRGIGEHLKSSNMRILSDLQLVYMVARNSTQ